MAKTNTMRKLRRHHNCATYSKVVFIEKKQWLVCAVCSKPLGEYK